MYIYIRKMFANDASGNQISFKKEVAEHFFKAPDSFLNKSANFSIHVFHISNPQVFTDIDLQPATDFRFSTKLNSFLIENKQTINEGDLLYVERFAKSYGVKLIKPSDDNYATFDALLNAQDRHFLLSTDEEEEEEEQSSDYRCTTNFESLPKEPRQIIYFGAPGTGKSHELNKEVKGKQYIRTIFHPDSDYSSFIGCYKPSSKDGKIEYKFKPQAFTLAYLNSWLTNDPFYLVIEEINRGNCAQIFGDIFQLLDRKDGESDYKITPDNDLSNFISESFKEKLESGTIINKREDIPDEILSGKVMWLPSNLYIRATMNTSDQSLFPMDSAFKRRWDWRYFAIRDEGQKYEIVVDETSEKFDWWKTIESINEKILATTKSADKQLGYWFAKLPKNEKVISADTFVSKVIFYLWNDVFKDYNFGDNNPFTKETTFEKFFDNNGNIIKSTVLSFINDNYPSETDS